MEILPQFKPYLEEVDRQLLKSLPADLPETLKEPILYFLNLPGKKIRPLLTLFAAEAVGGSRSAALPAAAAMELFHDFTLIHDDIMDRDELRRGFQTMHVKYGEGAAILVGDALIGLSLQQLLSSPPGCLGELVNIFTETLVKVCEGQALDKEFETKAEVSTRAYLEMIAKKTAWLMKTAAALGAICGGGKPEQVHHLSEFGYHLGLGFQIQDDLLDFVADESKLGKKVGSDFRMDKKTYVTLSYRELRQADREAARRYPRNPADFASVEEFQRAIRAIGVVEAAGQRVERYLHKAIASLERVASLDSNHPLTLLTGFLRRRQF